VVQPRRFAAAAQPAVAELLEADLSGSGTAVVMIDGLNIAGEMIVVALAITGDNLDRSRRPRTTDLEMRRMVSSDVSSTSLYAFLAEFYACATVINDPTPRLCAE
jgi:hypothetical protein